jgi:DNA-binding MarR family transcriptional regulator
MNIAADAPDIDNVDFAIMTLINNADRPLWKNRIHKRLHDRQDRLPITSGVSVQTVGRRVDSLQEDGHLETVIASPDDLKRDLIIAFSLTDSGETALHQKREAILKQLINDTIFRDDKHTDIGKDALTALMNDHFCGDDRPELAADDHEERELLAILTLYYAEQEALDIFGTEDKQELYETVTENDLLPRPAAP